MHLRTAVLHAKHCSSGFLLPQPSGHRAFYAVMLSRLAKAARRAGCSAPVTPHRLRHTYATEMLRAGVSLPVLKQLLGHRSINMTMRYVQVSQNDLPRQCRLLIADHYLRQITASKSPMPLGRYSRIGRY